MLCARPAFLVWEVTARCTEVRGHTCSSGLPVHTRSPQLSAHSLTPSFPRWNSLTPAVSGPSAALSWAPSEWGAGLGPLFPVLSQWGSQDRAGLPLWATQTAPPGAGPVSPLLSPECGVPGPLLSVTPGLGLAHGTRVSQDVPPLGSEQRTESEGTDGVTHHRRLGWAWGGQPAV